MNEEIMVKERSDLIVSQKTKRTYFTIVDQNGRKLICFDSGLYNEMPVDSMGTYEVTLGKTDQDTPRIERAQDASAPKGQPATEPVEPPKSQPPSKNRAFALSYAKDIACAKIQAGKEATLKDLLNMANTFDIYLEKGLTEDALKLYSQIQKEFKKEES